MLELVSRTDAALQAGDILDKHPLFQKAYLDAVTDVYGVPNLTDAIRQADQLMYLAKQQKNQVQYRIIMGGREK